MSKGGRLALELAGRVDFVERSFSARQTPAFVFVCQLARCIARIVAALVGRATPRIDSLQGCKNRKRPEDSLGAAETARGAHLRHRDSKEAFVCGGK